MDAIHKATSNVCTAQMSPINRAVRYAVYHKTDGVKTIVNGVQGVSQLFASELISHSLLPIFVKAFEAKHISVDEKYYPEDACSLQPTISASGECDQEVPGEHQTDLGTKSAHGMNPDSAVMPHISMRIRWTDDSQGVPFDELRRIKQETEDVEENRTKGLIIVEIELVAVKSHKDLGSSGWNGWQSIVMETEYDRVWGGQC